MAKISPASGPGKGVGQRQPTLPPAAPGKEQVTTVARPSAANPAVEQNSVPTEWSQPTSIDVDSVAIEAARTELAYQLQPLADPESTGTNPEELQQATHQLRELLTDALAIAGPDADPEARRQLAALNDVEEARHWGDAMPGAHERALKGLLAALTPVASDDEQPITPAGREEHQADPIQAPAPSAETSPAGGGAGKIPPGRPTRTPEPEPQQPDEPNELSKQLAAAPHVDLEVVLATNAVLGPATPVTPERQAIIDGESRQLLESLETAELLKALQFADDETAANAGLRREQLVEINQPLLREAVRRECYQRELSNPDDIHEIRSIGELAVREVISHISGAGATGHRRHKFLTQKNASFWQEANVQFSRMLNEYDEQPGVPNPEPYDPQTAPHDAVPLYDDAPLLAADYTGAQPSDTELLARADAEAVWNVVKAKLPVLKDTDSPIERARNLRDIRTIAELLVPGINLEPSDPNRPVEARAIENTALADSEPPTSVTTLDGIADRVNATGGHRTRLSEVQRLKKTFTNRLRYEAGKQRLFHGSPESVATENLQASILHARLTDEIWNAQQHQLGNYSPPTAPPRLTQPLGGRIKELTRVVVNPTGAPRSAADTVAIAQRTAELLYQASRTPDSEAWGSTWLPETVDHRLTIHDQPIRLAELIGGQIDDLRRLFPPALPVATLLNDLVATRYALLQATAAAERDFQTISADGHSSERVELLQSKWRTSVGEAGRRVATTLTSCIQFAQRSGVSAESDLFSAASHGDQPQATELGRTELERAEAWRSEAAQAFAQSSRRPRRVDHRYRVQVAANGLRVIDDLTRTIEDSVQTGQPNADEPHIAAIHRVLATFNEAITPALTAGTTTPLELQPTIETATNRLYGYLDRLQQIYQGGAPATPSDVKRLRYLARSEWQHLIGQHSIKDTLSRARRQLSDVIDDFSFRNGLEPPPWLRRRNPHHPSRASRSQKPG